MSAPPIAPGRPPVLLDDQELDAGQRPREAHALLGLQNVAGLREGVGVDRVLGNYGRGGDALDRPTRPRIEDVRVPSAPHPESALGVPAGRDRAVLDLVRT